MKKIFHPNLFLFLAITMYFLLMVTASTLPTSWLKECTHQASLLDFSSGEESDGDERSEENEIYGFIFTLNHHYGLSKNEKKKKGNPSCSKYSNFLQDVTTPPPESILL